MGKLILCTGNYAKNPYEISKGSIRLYSIEELCYYLYHNLYYIKEEMFSEEFLRWVEEELQLKKLAAKIKVLVEQNYSIKDIVVTIFCNCDYYSEKEIRDAAAVLDEIELLSDEQKACLKADNYLENGRYAKAASIYELLMADTKTVQAMEKEEQGRLYHNLAVAYVNIASYQEAAIYFERAYKVGENEESLKQYLFALKLSGDTAHYTEALEKYEVSEEKRRAFERELGRYMMDSDDYAECKAVQKLRNLRQMGRVGEYYDGIDTVINHWKESYLSEMDVASI